MYYLGIDLGTSSVKIVCIDENGNIISIHTQEYPITFPQPGWSQQEPQDWWEGVIKGCKEITKRIDGKKIKGISFGGQMHGLVVLDNQDQVIRPAILWNDGRSEKECQYLNEIIGKDTLSSYCANIAYAGFTAPKLLWMKKNEPDNFARINKIMLPKDYIAYRFSGIFSTDVSDASGTLFFDVQHKCWSKEMLEICGIKEEQLPKIYESYEVTGKILPKIAQELGLSEDVSIIAGAGDNAAAAIGTGTIQNGSCNISLGTSGTIFIASDNFCVDAKNALHSFAHANGRYHLMGCILSAASCNKWWMDDILKTTDYTNEQMNLLSSGKNRVYFLPYLMGERSPHNDSFVRGTFLNMSMNTKREDMTLAVLEGVAFAIKDSFEIAKSQGIHIKTSKICGGGAKSKLWKQIMANVLNIDIEVPQIEEGPGYGAAILASVGCGQFENVEEACTKLLHVKDVIHPDKESAKNYEERYQYFKKMYPMLRPLYTEMNKED